MQFKRYHVRLLVDRFAECYRFYRDVLGLPVRCGAENGDYAEFKTDAVHIALCRRALMAAAMGTAMDPSGDARPADAALIVLRVEDVDAAAAAVVENGASMTTAPCDRPLWGCRTAHLRDPAGNLIEINGDL